MLTPATDLTGKVRLRGLPAGEQIHYRVRLADLHDQSLTSEPVPGGFRTAPRSRRDVRFVWSGDIAGQGWGINPDFGGMPHLRGHGARRAGLLPALRRPSTPTARSCETVTLPDGSIWRNIVTQEKSKVAETLDEFRGQHSYNLLDDNLRAFLAEVPRSSQWDDHEVLNNWYPGEILDDAAYTEKRRRRAAGAGPAGLPRVPARAAAAAGDAERVYRKSRTARCSTCSCSTCAPTGRQQRRHRPTPDRDTGSSAPRNSRG